MTDIAYVFMAIGIILGGGLAVACIGFVIVGVAKAYRVDRREAKRYEIYQANMKAVDMVMERLLEDVEEAKKKQIQSILDSRRNPPVDN